MRLQRKQRLLSSSFQIYFCPPQQNRLVWRHAIHGNGFADPLWPHLPSVTSQSHSGRDTLRDEQRCQESLYCSESPKRWQDVVMRDHYFQYALRSVGRRAISKGC